ncbi:hypothetical protein, partial [Paraburkholderia sp. J76]|uniref:hypothetical protein n=1 Tax=Paraburkholderia sp. J76 TaxID=2805439 RepID=UPI002ABD7B17
QSKTVNADNDTIEMAAFSGHVNGNGNQIAVDETAFLDLNGSGNTIASNAASGSLSVSTTTGSFAEQDGSIALGGNIMPGSITLTGGVATVQLGNGNVATISNVLAGTELEYTDASGTVTTSVLTDTDMVNLGGNLFEVVGPVQTRMNNSIFEVQGGASLKLTGSSNTVFMDNGATSVTVSGSGDTVVGSGCNGGSVTLSGSDNVATLGSNSSVFDNGDNDT